MKILLISDNYYPETNALANRSTVHSRVWSKTNNVTVLTCFPNYPLGKKFLKYRKKFLFNKEVSENLTIYRIWSFISKKDNSYLNFIDYLSFGLSSFFFSLILRPDVIIGSSPPLPVAFFSFLSAKIRGVKLFIEMRDLWVDSIKELKITKSNKVLKLLFWAETLMLKYSDKILCVTNSIKKKIISRGIDKKKIVIRPNGFSVLKNINCKKLSIKLNKKKINILYSGTIGFAQDFSFIVKIAKDFVNELNFHIVGNGSQTNFLKRTIKKENIKNINLIKTNGEYINQNNYKKFDYGISCLKNEKVFKTVIPSKLYDYAANNLPILFIGPKGEAYNLIKKYSLGIYINQNEKNLKKKIYYLMKIKNKFNFKTKNFKENFNREYIARAILKDIVSE